ncbi:MAG: cell division protein SepF [Acidimicrobiaceae bacterium]|nr:cell division protein SepF [Acidimicrobiaceae bacterium]
MNEKMRKALGFLGLVEDDYNEYTATEASRPFTDEMRDEPAWAPRQQQSAPSRPSTPSPRINPTPAPRTGGPAPVRVQNSSPNLAPRSSSLSLLDNGQPVARARPAATGGLRGVVSYAAEQDIEILTPFEFNECQRITDQLRLNRSVILVVTQCGPAVARRLIDFAAGTSYALRATVETLEKGAVYAICPHGASLSPEVRARLVSSNYTTVGY